MTDPLVQTNAKTSGRRVAIHQPNFFPWLGYFDKINRSDVFILLDDVQYQKTGGSWSNRVKLLINAQAQWVTAPIDRNYHGTRKVNEVVFSTKENWREKLLKTIKLSYGRAPFFREVWPCLEELILNPEQSLANFNVRAITEIAQLMGINTDGLILSSTLSSDSTATQRLIDLTLAVGGNSYMCGGGADGYQQNQLFEEMGITLVYQNFRPFTYAQHGTHEFTPGLSAIDTLMNIGSDALRSYWEKNRG